MAENTGLTDEERAELEALRAEKAAREKAERDRAERAELEQLRAQKAAAEATPRVSAAAQRPASEAERAQLERDAAARERGRKLMEPDDDDLKMPLGQKAVIAAILIVAVAWGAATLLG